ncbi:unnamed protein product [Euphydryas editha]|uniref:Tyrosine-protein phosphatase domain-containing protein n=1 Tax=Euphydryas editha TaxID=104508 RepID=A0AAU9TL10_EUPED|nr:unnamed protein product [Euphydryas editha]
MKTENSKHPLVNSISCEEEYQPTERIDKWDRKSIVGNIGFDMFSTYLVDGFNIKRKFVIINNSGPEVDSYNFWSFIRENCCKVIFRFDGTSKKRNWLNHSQDDAYAVENIMERQSRKITHLQYHLHYLDELPSSGSAQLISFLEMVNKNRGAISKKSASGPNVIHSIGCFERAVTICVLDICLDQLIETNLVSVLNVG